MSSWDDMQPKKIKILISETKEQQIYVELNPVGDHREQLYITYMVHDRVQGRTWGRAVVMVRGDSYCCGLSHLGGWQLSPDDAINKDFFKILHNRTRFPDWAQQYFKSYFQMTATTSSNLCRLAMKYGGYVIHQVFHNDTGSSTVAILGRPKPSTEEHYNEGWKRKNYNPTTVEFDGDADDEDAEDD